MNSRHLAGGSGSPAASRTILVLLLLALLLSLAVGCNRPGRTNTGGTTTGPKPPATGLAYKIGINQYMQHPVADEVAKGILDELRDQGITDENGSRVVVKNANGDQAVAMQINKQFVSDKMDVIIPIATPSAQSACKETTTIPIVFGAITDPVKAGIAESMEHPGGNKTGTSNRWPFEKQIGLIKQIVPKATRVGIILNPSEGNTEAAMSYIRPALQKAGLKGVGLCPKLSG